MDRGGQVVGDVGESRNKASDVSVAHATSLALFRGHGSSALSERTVPSYRLLLISHLRPPTLAHSGCQCRPIDERRPPASASSTKRASLSPVSHDRRFEHSSALRLPSFSFPSRARGRWCTASSWRSREDMLVPGSAASTPAPATTTSEILAIFRAGCVGAGRRPETRPCQSQIQRSIFSASMVLGLIYGHGCEKLAVHHASYIDSPVIRSDAFLPTCSCPLCQSKVT